MPRLYGAEHPYNASVLAMNASLLDQLGRAKDGLPMAEAAVTIYDKKGGGGQAVAEARDILARLLWKVSPADRTRAAELARKALAGYTLDTPAVQSRRSELVAWMRANKLKP
jgi:hypothetical protein